MSLREVLLPIQLAASETEIERLKRSTLSVRPVYCGTDPSCKSGSSSALPASIQLRDKLHYVSFRPSLHGFYRLHFLLDGRSYCQPVLLHILPDGTLLSAAVPPSPLSDDSTLVDPRPHLLRSGDSEHSDPLELPSQGPQGAHVHQKFSELVQAIKVATSRRTNKSGVTTSTHRTSPPKLQSAKPFGLPDFLKRIRTRHKPELSQLVRELTPPPAPGEQLRVSRSTEELNNASIRVGRGSVRLHEYLRPAVSPQQQQQHYICCICGSPLETSAVRLYETRFCEEDFSRFYLQRNVREHFLVPVLQETYLPGLGGHGALPQVNLKGLDIRYVKMGLDFFRLLDVGEEGWIGRHQLSSLLIRILIKILGEESQTRHILNSSPYKAMTSGMGLDKRGRVHEIEFLACLAFCVREYLDMRTILRNQTRPRLIPEMNPFSSPEGYEMELPDHLTHRSSYQNPLLEDDLSLDLSASQVRPRMSPRSDLQRVVKNRVSQGDPQEPDEGWMMY